MRRCVLILIVALFGWASPAAAQPVDPVTALVVRAEQVLGPGNDADAIRALFAPTADAGQVDAFVADAPRATTTRAVVRERDRQDLQGGLTRVIVDTLIETAAVARVSTWRLDIAGAPDETRVIQSAERLSVVDGLARLALSDRQFAVRNLRISGEDLDIVIPSGTAFVAEVHGLPTAIVVLGNGEVTFAPAPDSEKGQLTLLTGHDALRARVSRLFLRVNPADLTQRVTMNALEPMATDRTQLERARKLFTEQVGLSYSLDLSDLSRETWNLVPPIGDVLIDMDLARFGLLSYARSGGEPEDITLFDRKRRKNLSVYTSLRNLRARGALRYDDAERLEYVVTHYNVDVSFDPSRLWLEGRADLDMRITALAAQTITLRLAEPLVVRAVTSDEHGRLLALRVRGQNNIVVNLPDSVRQGQTLRLRVAYGGRLPPITPERETIGATQDQVMMEMPIEPEPRFVYSHRAYWYPQSSVSTFATARIRVTVPGEFTVIGSGVPEAPTPVTSPDGRVRRAFAFSAGQPVRYLSIAVSRFVRAATTQVTRQAQPQPATGNGQPATGPRLSRLGNGVFHETTDVEVWSQPRQTSRARGLLETTVDILRFYGDLVDDLPFPSFRLVLAEDRLPGGHSPAYFALLHQPMPGTPFTWGRDPVSFGDFPQFFLAHELAHQFWGQAVAGENYHEQWISEGFAQYFALLYAQKVRPGSAVTRVMRQMYRSAVEASDEGAIWLGYRIGHLKGESRVFRATVYNKSALVLHMLQRSMGEAAFARGLQRFYGQSRFRRVGTDDLRVAMEAEGGQPLGRFFDGWVYGRDIPTLRYAWDLADDAAAGAPGSAVVRLRLVQGPHIHDIPVTATIIYADGRTEDVVVVSREASTEVRIPVSGRVREVRLNEDYGALVKTERMRSSAGPALL